MLDHRDLLVPQDIRERTGAFYTPLLWARLSHEYIARALGENWQEEYMVWDCASGRGNLFPGLSCKDNLWASTLDSADVDIMKERISSGLKLWENHVFQFDFLNDSFEKLPSKLKEIIDDPKRRKRLLIYINPPYAEATSSKTMTGSGKHKDGIARTAKAHEEYNTLIGAAANQLFTLFFARIYKEIPGCILAEFSTFKPILGSHFKKFRSFFVADFLSGFVVPSKTFENPSGGNFPVGFKIWNLSAERHNKIICDVYDADGNALGQKHFHHVEDNPRINNWAKLCDVKDKTKAHLAGFISNPAPDFQQAHLVDLRLKRGSGHFNYYGVTSHNLMPGVVYFAARLVIGDTWLNDCDQFLFPHPSWKSDTEFQSDCLAFTLFHTQNHISCKEGINHWIPFTEEQIGSRERFESHFIVDFMNGKLPEETQKTLDAYQEADKINSAPLSWIAPTAPLIFSSEAQAVFSLGRELWRYYHSQPAAQTNAGLYDIKWHFQGYSTKNGRETMNGPSGSSDAEYRLLLEALSAAMEELTEKIIPKIYEHGFLLEGAG